MASLPSEKALRGRVFARRRAFLALPAVEQQRVRALATFLNESHVLRQHRVGFYRAVEGISCDQLADIVLGYLEKHPQLLEQQLEDQKMEVAAAAATAASPAARVSVALTLNRKQVMWKLMDELVLSGVLAIHNEKYDPVLASKLNDFARPGVLFVTTRALTDDASAVSVWYLHDDAILAGTFQRASKLFKTTGGRDTYYVVDGTHKALYWFESDGATNPEGSLKLQGAVVRSSGPYYIDLPNFQINVTCATTHKSVSMFGSDAADWVNPLLRLGAVYDMRPLCVISKTQLAIQAIGMHR